MDASTLLVVFLLVSAASLASYLTLPASESPQRCDEHLFFASVYLTVRHSAMKSSRSNRSC